MRDEGLRRVSSITRWVAACAVAGTAVLAGVVYKATPGRATSGAPSGQGADNVGSSAGVADPNGGTSGFQAPPQAPVPVQQPPLVRSGAS